MYPYNNPGLFSRGLSLTKGINWSNFLDGTQKTLGIINQAIPIVYQVKPIINNAKTMLRIASSLATNDTKPSPNNQNSIPTNNTNNTLQSYSNNRPIFYI